jgi:hypothetical protein
MIRPLVEKSAIDEAFAVFSRTITAGGQPVEATIGCQGDNETATVTWHADQKLWVLLDPKRLANHFWCAFGTEDPSDGSVVSITCEISPPSSAISRRSAGLFINDNNDVVYLAHSGRIGGGRAGTGKAAFLTSRNQNDVVPVQFPDGKETEYIVIGEIDADDFLDDVARFVHTVADFKDIAAKDGK